MTPLEIYQKDIKEHGFQQDDAQLEAVSALDVLYHQYIEYIKTPVMSKPTGWKNWFGKKAQVSAPVAPKGLYFWGEWGEVKLT